MTADLQKPKASAMLFGIVALLVLLYLVSFTGSPAFLQWFGTSKTNATTFFTSRIFYWICLLLLGLYCIKIEKQRLLIWQEKNYKFLKTILSIFITLLIVYIGSFCIQKLLSLMNLADKSVKLSEMVAIFKSNKLLLVFTALTAGVVEELIFRAYLLPRLVLIFKSPLVAIIVSSLLFGLLHYKYGTISNVVIPVFIGLVFAYHYWKFRNIKILIICHFLVDLISLLVSVNQK